MKVVFKIVYWFAMQSRWYIAWTKLYRFFFEREWKYDVSNTLDKSKTFDPERLQTKLDLIEYRKDTWKQLWDVCHSPYYLHYVLKRVIYDYGQPEGSFDCDDFACLAANLLQPSLEPQLMNIVYKRKGKFLPSGHMVCVYKTEDGYKHMGNWGILPNFVSLASLEEVAKSVAQIADAELIGYTIFDKDLSFKLKVKI